jgi:hypothetical protein
MLKKLQLTNVTCILLVTICHLLLTHCRLSHALVCYSCSTEAGDSFCSEDNFNKKLPTVECPIESDVCVRALQLTDAHAKSGSTVFRSCGSSVNAAKPEITNLGFPPLYNECIVYKVVEKNIYQNSTFQICSCSFDLGNASGEMCAHKRK